MKKCTKSCVDWRLGMLFTTLLAGVACSGSAMAEKRVFTVLAVEPKGGANVTQEALPTAPLPDGGGYVMRQPDQTGRWEVSAYVWQPAQIVVNEGDEVTLEFIGINGASHPTRIEGLVPSFTLQRGRAHLNSPDRERWEHMQHKRCGDIWHLSGRVHYAGAAR